MRSFEFAAPRCPGSLKNGFTTYNPATIRNVFNGKSVFHVLDENHDNRNWDSAAVATHHHPGQLWFRMELQKNKLRPSLTGDYLLKTVDESGQGIRFAMEQPANEHLCLQIGKQVFEIETIPNALIFFPDGKPAIISRQYPAMTEFVSFEILFSKSAGSDKTAAVKNYQQIMDLMDLRCAASAIMKERFFIQLLFSWLVTNDIAHTKIAGLVKTDRGDFVTAPLNGIQCTRIHRLCDELPLPGGLFDGDKNTSEFREYGHYTRNEFTALARRSGMPGSRTEKIFDFVTSRSDEVHALTDQAFLPEETKNIFKFNFKERMARLV